MSLCFPERVADIHTYERRNERMGEKKDGERKRNRNRKRKKERERERERERDRNKWKWRGRVCRWERVFTRGLALS
jgi:hypothetical protein